MNIPKHIAIIMDGNGRWAHQRKKPRIFGHHAGIESVRNVVQHCASLGVKYLTLYSFSVENWSRPQKEVNALMRYLKIYLLKELKELMSNNIRLKTIGRIHELSPSVRKTLEDITHKTKSNKGLTLVLALNYGGRSEIVDAINRLREIEAKDISEETLAKYLDTSGMPDPDLVIRTSGELRLSNFLLWQSSYSEFWVTPTLWPDFRENDLMMAIQDYQNRQRRFGGVKSVS